MLEWSIESRKGNPYLLPVITKVILRFLKKVGIGENAVRDTKSTFCSALIEGLDDPETFRALTFAIQRL